MDDKWPWLVKLLGYDQVGSTAEGLKRFYYALLLDFEKRVYPHLTATSLNPVPDQAPSLSEVPGGTTPKMNQHFVPLQRTGSKVCFLNEHESDSLAYILW
jgi:hypothetical protein